MNFLDAIGVAVGEATTGPLQVVVGEEGAKRIAHDDNRGHERVWYAPECQTCLQVVLSLNRFKSQTNSRWTHAPFAAPEVFVLVEDDRERRARARVDLDDRC